MSNDAKPYGYEAVVEVSNTIAQVICQERRIHRKGRRSSVERAARLLPGFVRIKEVSPYTEQQWLNCFGEGIM